MREERRGRGWKEEREKEGKESREGREGERGRWKEKEGDRLREREVERRDVVQGERVGYEFHSLLTFPGSEHATQLLVL